MSAVGAANGRGSSLTVPGWFLYTLSAAFGVVATVVVLTKAWGESTAEAHEAKAASVSAVNAVAAHEPRIAALESERKADLVRWENSAAAQSAMLATLQRIMQAQSALEQGQSVLSAKIDVLLDAPRKPR